MPRSEVQKFSNFSMRRSNLKGSKFSMRRSDFERGGDDLMCPNRKLKNVLRSSWGGPIFDG